MLSTKNIVIMTDSLHSLLNIVEPQIIEVFRKQPLIQYYPHDYLLKRL